MHFMLSFLLCLWHHLIASVITVFHNRLYVYVKCIRLTYDYPSNVCSNCCINKMHTNTFALITARLKWMEVSVSLFTLSLFLMFYYKTISEIDKQLESDVLMSMSIEHSMQLFESSLKSFKTLCVWIVLCAKNFNLQIFTCNWKYMFNICIKLMLSLKHTLSTFDDFFFHTFYQLPKYSLTILHIDSLKHNLVFCIHNLVY